MPIDPTRLPPHVRTYRLARTFGWTAAEIDAQPAMVCDWLLAMAAIEDRVKAEAEARAQSQRGGV